MSGKPVLKAGFLVGLIIFTLFTAANAFAQSSPDDDIHISAIAEFYALHSYPNQKGHKALAVGPGGYSGKSFGKPSAGSAAKDAVKNCTAALRTAPYKSLARRKCVLFDVDGKRTGKATPVGVPFGTVAEGPDLPYKLGNRWEPTGVTHRGILLLLNGCNKLHGISGWVRAWVNFYRANGFRVVMPDSFAEPRDPEACGYPGENGIDAQTRSLKLRIAQTLRTIAILRQEYPGEAIYVHGHSEGGYIAQALGEKLAGIIVTGAPCGFDGAAVYWVGEGTPVLVVAGTEDTWFAKVGTAKALSSYCKKVQGAGKLTTASVRGMGHFAALWWPGVLNSVSKFLNVEPIAVARREAATSALPGILEVEMEQYRNAPKPKALAVHEKGQWSWFATVNAQYSSAETKLDVEEIALFDCDDRAGFDAFKDASHQHACVLVDVNGKPPAK